MTATFKQQFLTIFRKNIKVHLRSRALIKELFNLAIVIAVVIVLDKLGNQSNSAQSIPFYMAIAIMLFCRGVALSWVNERQSRQSEVQKIMGASNIAYYTAWMYYFILNGLFLSLVFIGILAAAGLMNQSNVGFGQIFGLYLLYLICSFSFVLFLTSFFSDSVLASQIITFVQLLSGMLYFLLFIQSFRSSRTWMQVTSLLPAVAFEFTIMAMGFGSSSSFFDTPFTSTQGFITLGILSVVYFILFVYLSLVLPNENGNHLHPLFFLSCFCKKKEPEELQQSFELANLSSARYYEQTKEQKNISMYLKNLRKSFDQKVIVNNLSLSLFQGEIFCLLGHNGAGKTTTINMLTGILQPDAGQINILGYDYYSEMSKIRSKTGVCLQIDVLYNQLSVQEHLEYYASIKGVPPELLETTVDQMIVRCGLKDERNKLTKELSGGNKRKTCLACASVGDSQLLFLDEPSSGLDPSSRRVIWTLIDSLRREGRTLILTTHHLEEAEALANRIGILAHGQMLVQGSCLYIKQRFGCGYYLQIALNQTMNLHQQKNMIRHKLKEVIAGFREDQQVNEHSLRFLLPYNQQENYASLFSSLEANGIAFSLRLSSLEDIFVKIGMDVQSVLTNDPLPELEKVKIPEYQPVYNMGTQVKHIFIKKFKTTFRSPSVFFSIILPILFIVVGIVIAMQAFQPSSDPKEQVLLTWSKYNTIAFFISLAYAFNTAQYCGAIVKEREIKFKYLSYVMGMKKGAYWVGTISFDLLMFCVPYLLIFLVIGCFPSDQNQQLVQSFGWLALSLVLFALSFLPFTYLWSFAFDNSRSAYRFYPFLVYLIFYVIPSLPIYIAPENTSVHYILPLISPLLGLTSCIMSKQMLGSSNYSFIISYEAIDSSVQVYTNDSIWYPLVIFTLQAIVFFSITIFLDNLKFNLKDRQDMLASEQLLQQSDDLKKEKAKIQSGREIKPILVDSLFKKYPNGYIAIKDNSFVVEKGQTFGLLGPNGAGKSTTFNILTAAIPKTHGRVLLNGSQVNRAVDQIFTTVGVCPQFNPLYDEMTTAQHLQFFAGIKGLNGQQKQQIANFYLSNLQLDEYTDVRSKKLSGGNKRKLCVAMALVGNPSLVFLDEPSAGVDPIARRFLWNILHSSSADRNRSIVLTTHSINQAESLCDRIGILIKGEFYCIDSPRELKRRYGKGYRATLKCDTVQKLEEVKRRIRQSFSNYADEVFPEDLQICVQFSKEGFIFSRAFRLFYNDLLKGGLISQFQLSETTLEQVFIYLSKMQIERDNQPIEEKTSSFCCWQRSSAGCFCIC